MAKTRVFVTFKDDDMKFMNEILAWDEKKEFDFFFEPSLPRIGIHTPGGKELKAQLTEKIKTGTHLLCIIGKDAAYNDWINWEVQTASVTGRKVIAVRLEMHYKAPAALLNFGATWAKAYTFDALKKAIAEGESSSAPAAALPAGQLDPHGFG